MDEINQPLNSVQIEKHIHNIRNESVMLDSDLAKLYEVETRVLVQAMKRNIIRFPVDFAFQLTNEEFKFLTSQNVISKRGGRRSAPYAFTEQGVAMLASVLKSQTAAQVNIEIIRTFVKLRQMLISNKELNEKLLQLEQKYDQQFKVVFDALRQLMQPQPINKRPIGYIWPKEDE